MKNKKFLSLLLALAMVFSMSVSVFANDPAGGDASAANSNGWNFTATATVTIPTISVVVDTGTALLINPMGFEVNIDTLEAAEAGDDNTTTNKIVSPVYHIENSSPMDLDVNVSGSLGNITSSSTTPVISIAAAAPIATDDTKNSVFIYAQFGEVEEDATTTGVYKFTSSSNITATTPPYAAPADNAPSVPQLALTNKAPAKPIKVGTISKATAGTDNEVQAGMYGFQFRGDCNANATKDWNLAAGETITATLAFTFKPSST